MLQARVNWPVEVTLTAEREATYRDTELDAVFTGPGGETRRVPGFWAGERLWRVRFAPPTAGRWQYRTEARPAIRGLHEQSGTLDAAPAASTNPLFRHGRLRASTDRRYLEHADGTPFFWLGDTWWFGLCTRLDWPDGFRALTADRVAKGFSVIQIVAGLYPDVPPTLDPRGANEAGFPLSADFAQINPTYFDQADLKIGHLVHAGLVPAVVGAWGYYLLTLGEPQMQRFWRYLVARWGAWPVVWCLAGEATMPYYLTKDRTGDAEAQRHGWSRLAAFVRALDGHHNVITIHPTRYGREQVDDPALLDLEWLQTGHQGYDSLASNVESVQTAVGRTPRLPVLVSEVNYEGICGRSWQEIQRACFWQAVLSGACGHTYGASGLWQMNTAAQQHGKSPHGRNWGTTLWADAARLPGGAQVGLGARFLRELPWWRLTPHPEWVTMPWKKEDLFGVSAAGIPGELRLFYQPLQWNGPVVQQLEPRVRYLATYFDPITGARHDLGPIEPDLDGTWKAPFAPVVQDWVLMLRKG